MLRRCQARTLTQSPCWSLCSAATMPGWCRPAPRCTGKTYVGGGKMAHTVCDE